MQRYLRLFGIGVLAIFVQSTLVTLSPVRDALPDLVIPAVLFAATVDIDIVGGVALALVLGYVFDLLAGIPPGLHCTAFQLVYLLGRSVQRRFYLAGVLYEVSLTFGAVILVAAVELGARFVFQDARFTGYAAIAITTLVRALLTALLAPAVFWAARQILSGRRQTLLRGWRREPEG